MPEDRGTSASSPSRKTYRDSPISQAICEFRFSQETAWNLTIPGLLYERLRDFYDGDPQQQIQAEIDLSGGAQVRTPSMARVQLQNKDATRTLVVDHRRISFSMFPPYEGWDVFRPLIVNGLNACEEVARTQHVARLGVRYLNKISVSSEGGLAGLKPLFNDWPYQPGGPESTLSAFRSTVVSEEPNGTRLSLTFATLGPAKGAAASDVLLDIDAWRAWTDEPLPIDDALSEVDALKRQVTEAFEAFITSVLREQLGVIEEETSG